MINAKATYTLNVINKMPNGHESAPPCLLSMSAGASPADPATARHRGTPENGVEWPWTFLVDTSTPPRQRPWEGQGMHKHRG